MAGERIIYTEINSRISINLSRSVRNDHIDLKIPLVVGKISEAKDKMAFLIWKIK